MVDAPTDERLLADYLADGGNGFEILVRRYSKELYQFVLRFTHNSAAAEDVVQEAFLQVHLSAASFDPSRRFKPWLFTIAANKARDWLRSRSRRSEVPLDARVGDVEEGSQSFADLLAGDELPSHHQVEAEEQCRAVQQVIEQMPDSLREVLVLAYYHRLPYKDLAEVLDVPLGTVKSRLHAAVGHFARRYQAAIEAGGHTADPLEKETGKET
ncbi:MAG TPA: sigma-70 family RNA polymerase sigma factor [Phycisphaerae bacterium]|nr:sigma-70 family RNA polymerase sigma factor [Phycisphaerae bacterium]